MSLNDILLYVKDSDNKIIILVIIMLLLQLIEISPIQLSPWSAIRRGISKLLIYDIQQEIQQLAIEIKTLNYKLDTHITESIEADLRARRSTILRAAADIAAGKDLNEEHLNYLVSECDAYRQYCKNNNIQNGVAKVNMAIIYKAYKKKMEKDFIEGGLEQDESNRIGHNRTKWTNRFGHITRLYSIFKKDVLSIKK